MQTEREVCRLNLVRILNEHEGDNNIIAEKMGILPGYLSRLIQPPKADGTYKDSARPITVKAAKKYASLLGIPVEEFYRPIGGDISATINLSMIKRIFECGEKSSKIPFRDARAMYIWNEGTAVYGHAYGYNADAFNKHISPFIENESMPDSALFCSAVEWGSYK